MAGVVILPEKIFKKINSQILPEWRVCFFSSLIVGLFAHLYKITNWLPNWDSLVFRYDPQNMMALGRWFLPVVCSFGSFYDLSFLGGIAAIIFHALGAVCVCRILNIREKLTAFLIGAVIVSFPTVTSVMMYNYVADGYSIAFFMSVLAALLLTGEKPRYIAASLIIALSMGIYQAYITVTVMLVLMKLLDEMIFGKASFGTVLKKAVRILLSGILGAAIYFVVLKVLLAAFSTELLDYQGMGDTAALSGFDIASSLYVIKETFVGCFFDISGGISVFTALNFFILIFTSVYYIRHIVKNESCRRPANIFMTVVLGIMLILGAAALAFINPAVDYHNLMLMGYFVFYMFFLVLYERGSEKSQKHTAIKCWTVLITALIMIADQVVIANVSYHKAQMAYERSYGVLVRIADRIEQMPGSEECEKLLVIGALDKSEAYSVNLPPDITGITDGYILRADDETVGQSVLCSALNDYCGKNYIFIDDEEKKELLQREDISSMPQWPEKGCVAVTGDTVVIKLGTEGEK